jgi:hypothetical protein
LAINRQLNSDLSPVKDLNRENCVLSIEQLASGNLETSVSTVGLFGIIVSEQSIQIEKRSEAFKKFIAELKNYTLMIQLNVKRLRS